MSAENTSPAQAAEPLVRVVSKPIKNSEMGNFVHGEHVLTPGGEATVPKHVADIWCRARAFGLPLVVVAGSEEDKRVSAANEAVNTALKVANLTLEEKVKELEARLAAAESAAPVKRGPGRPPKVADHVEPPAQAGG